MVSSQQQAFFEELRKCKPMTVQERQAKQKAAESSLKQPATTKSGATNTKQRSGVLSFNSTGKGFAANASPTSAKKKQTSPRGQVKSGSIYAQSLYTRQSIGHTMNRYDEQESDDLHPQKHMEP